MGRHRWLGALLFACLTATGAAGDGKPDGLYRAVAIVTGQGETNRQIGFKDCLGEVLVRVSGDPRVVTDPLFESMRAEAGRYVASFKYRDRMEGIPIHDEQGTHDRPHDLTCIYEPATVDGLLGRLGRRAWLAERPTLAVFLRVERGEKRFVLREDDPNAADMRESFAHAAEPLVVGVVFPTGAQLDLAGAARNPAAVDPDRLAGAARAAGAEEALVGSLVWSDADLGWRADWRLFHGGRAHRWQAKGVSFDEAFRIAVGGTTQILSGNGAPGSAAAIRDEAEQP